VSVAALERIERARRSRGAQPWPMRFLRPTLFATWLAAVTAVLGVLVAREPQTAQGAPASGVPTPGKLAIDELDVRRINVIEPDGKPRVIITSRARIPGASFGGKEYPHPGRDIGGGLLFYNDEGTEAGGLCYSNRSAGGKTDNQMLLTADQHNQNELMGLTYSTEHGQRIAGLTVYDDHPDRSLLPLIEAHTEMTRGTGGQAAGAAPLRPADQG
jgi:hypothetical protein